MIKPVDMYTIATSGLNAQNKLLQTTSNNIANVNTEGYSRQRTEFSAELYGGVGPGETTRIFNTFAQNQLRRDTSALAEAQSFYDKTSQVDNILANEANSIASALSRFFGSMQTATDEPTNIAARQLVLGQGEALLGQIGSMAGYLSDREKELELEFTSVINRANSLITSISDINANIRGSQGSIRGEPSLALQDALDKSILELAELVSIETRTMGDGTKMVNLSTGQALVMEGSNFNLFELSGDPDITYKSLQLSSTGKPTTINVKETSLGGEVAALFRYRDEILDTSQRTLSQLAMSFADAMNSQNRLGMDYDGQLGSDIFELPAFQGLNFRDNSDLNLVIEGRVQSGQFNQLTTADYEITIDALGAGTVDFTVALVDSDGEPVTDIDGNPISQSYVGQPAAPGTYVPILDGLEVSFSSGTSYAVNDKFVLQPTKNTATAIEMKMTRPEDLALASPLRVQSDIDNLGDAKVTATSVTNTRVDNGFTTTQASAFDGNGGIHGVGASPAPGLGAPAEIRFTSANDYEVRDAAGNLITTVTGASDLNNILAKAAATPGWPAQFAAQDDYPGFDVSLQGVPKAGDRFTLGFNTNGVEDNRNGLILSAMQNQDLVRRSAGLGAGATNTASFHERYASLVGSVGEITASADIRLQANAALEQQSRDRVESVSGVNLDEEAANLLKFQQAYAASARILTTAQSMFDTILASVR